MPDSLARPCVQGKQTISEEIVADAIGAVEIKRGGACCGVDNAAPGIERHSGPIVRGPTGLPRILRPSVIAKFTGMRDGVERPAQPTGSNVVGANVAGRRRERSEEHTSELQSLTNLVCRLLLEKKNRGRCH